MSKYLSLSISLVLLSSALGAAPRPHFESTFSIGSVDYYRAGNSDALGNEIEDSSEYDANGSLFLDISGRYKQLYYSTRNALVSAKGEATEYDGEIFELYYTHNLEAGDLSLGRKGTSYGSGQGLKPLALFEGDDSSNLLDDNSIGADIVMYESFGLVSSWAVLATDAGALNDAAELAWRWYGFIDNKDLFLLVSANEDDGGRFGAGFTDVFGDSLKLYGEFLYLEQYEKNLTTLTPEDPIATSNPFASEQYHSGLRSILGIDYSFAGNWNLIAEIWHDSLAYSDSEWDKLLDVRAAQLDLYNNGQVDAASANGNLQWNRQALNSERSLRQGNTLLRLRGDLSAWEPIVELLYLPADSGYINTWRAKFDLGASNEFELAMRYFGGPEDSVPRLLDYRWQAGIHWRMWLH